MAWTLEGSSDTISMGSIIAQDVFQRKLDAIFLSVPGVTGIAYDMIIYGKPIRNMMET